MTGKQDRFGVRMGRYLAAHEAYVESRLAAGNCLAELTDYHDRKIAWLQHERLVHLLALMLAAVVFLLAFVLVLLREPDWRTVSLLLISLSLLAAYLLHYFRLENRVQHWYRLSDRLHQQLIAQAERGTVASR